nr:putative capsid [Marmot picobirnavirus]
MNQNRNTMNKKKGPAKKKKVSGAQRSNWQDKLADAEKDKGQRDERAKTKFEGSRHMDVTNHPTWYFKSEAVLKDVASYSYGRPLGSDLRYWEHKTFNVDKRFVSALCTSVPGLMTINLGILPGVSKDGQSPVNLGMQNAYTFVRYKNSGHANYDAPDLGMYYLTMDSIYTCWNWEKRIYGEASTYSATNRYKARAYAAAEGVDYDDLCANLCDFRAYLNMAAERISAFCVPASFTYMVRHSWLFTNIFKDADTTKAQEYMYVPDYFYKYEEVASEKGGMLSPVNVLHDYKWSPDNSTNLLKVKDLIELLNSLIDAAMMSEDIGIMSGDVLKAYERGGLFTLSPIDPDYKVEAAYDRQVLSQIENAEVWYQDTNLASFAVTQDPDTNWILCQPQFTIGTTSINKGSYLNFHWENPTPEDVIEATRLKFATNFTVSRSYATLESCGSEVALKCTVYFYAQSDQLNSKAADFATQHLYCQILPSQLILQNHDIPNKRYLQEMMQQLWLWNAFDWAPAFQVAATDAETNLDTYYWPDMWDWDVYTSLDQGDIEAMHLLALQSEFNVPN